MGRRYLQSLPAQSHMLVLDVLLPSILSEYLVKPIASLLLNFDTKTMLKFFEFIDIIPYYKINTTNCDPKYENLPVFLKVNSCGT